jgi:hypothetical protein
MDGKRVEVIRVHNELNLVVLLNECDGSFPFNAFIIRECGLQMPNKDR